jgi:hypothetical protein
MRHLGSDVTLSSAFFIRIGDDFCYAQGFRVEGRLRDKSVGERDSEETGHAGGQAEEEDIPMEPGRLSKGKFRALCY